MQSESIASAGTVRSRGKWIRRSHRRYQSLPSKDRWTFFAKGHSSLMHIRRRKTAHNCLNLVLEGTFQRRLERTIEQLLALAQGKRRTAQHGVGECLHLGVQSVRLDQPVEQPHALSDGC